MKNGKTHASSVEHRVDNFRTQNGVPRLPEALAFQSERQEEIYNMLYAGRSPEDWFDSDLMYLHSIARYQVEIEKCFEALDDEGMVIHNAHGNPKESPWIGILSKFQYHQKALISSLSLMTTPASGGEKAANAKKNAQKGQDAAIYAAMQKPEHSESLLAAPRN